MSESRTTCGLACWMAKKDKCSCSCGGKNHGIMLREGRDAMPQRKRRIRGTIYRLEYVLRARTLEEWRNLTRPSGYQEAYRICRQDYGERRPVAPNSSAYFPKAFVQQVTKAAWKRWPETRSYPVRPYLVWVQDRPQLKVIDGGLSG